MTRAEVADATGYLRGLLQHSGGVMYVVEARTERFLLVNPTLEELVGLPASMILGRTAHDLFPAAVADEHREHNRQVLAAGTPLTCRETAPDRDGVPRAFLTQKFPLLAPDGTAYAVGGISFELTELEAAQRATEEQRRRVQAELDRAHRELSRSATRLSLLHTAATAANDAADIERAVRVLLPAVCDQFGWPVGHLLVRRTGADGSPVLASTGVWHLADPERHAGLTRRGLEEFAAGIGLVGPQLTDATPRAVEGIDQPGRFPRSAMFAEHGLRTGYLMPVLLGEELVAVCEFFAPGPARLDAEQRETLRLVGNELSRVAERDRARATLLGSEQRFRSVFANSPLAMALSDAGTGTFIAVNRAFCALLGREESELLGRSADTITHPDDRPVNAAIGAAALHGDGLHRQEKRYLHASGRPIPALLTLSRLPSAGGEQHLLAQVEDISARKSAEERLRHQARHDALTGLPNRLTLTHALAESTAEHPSATAVLFVDLDGFKVINDTRGHDAGDDVLVEVARRLRAAVRPTDLVARFGGDEFVVVCPGPVGEDDALAVAHRIERALATPVRCPAGDELLITASVGVVVSAGSGDRPSDLLRRADAAMYQAKRLGKDRVELYDDPMHEMAQSYARTEAALRRAIADQRLLVHYQPVIDLATGKVTGVEALVRLVDEAGPIPPDQFIAVAESTGLIVPLGSWVLREACQQVAEWRRRLRRPLSLAVNISARQAGRPDLLVTVVAALSAAGLDYGALALELTESALLEANESTLTQLNALRDLGVHIGIDDFGTGYSSMNYLRQFPVRFLKVDRSFVAGVPDRVGETAIVRAIVSLASELGLACVAEGVESPRQLAALRGMGASHAQGYLFAPPAAADQIAELLADPGPLAGTAG